MSNKEKGTTADDTKHPHDSPRPLKKARVDDTPNSDNVVVEGELEEVGEEMDEEEDDDTSASSDYSDDEEDSNSDSSICNSSDSDFGGLGDDDDIQKMPDGIEKYHYLQLSIKRTIRELETKRKDVLKKRDELISQEALKYIPRWQKRLNKLYRLQMKFKPEVTDEKTLRSFYKDMYEKKRYNFIWTLHIERVRIGGKKYNFYTKAGEYNDGDKFVNVVMQNAKNSKITCSNWDAAVLITQKDSPELFETLRESKLNLCRKIRDTFAEFASIRDTEVLYTESEY